MSISNTVRSFPLIDPRSPTPIPTRRGSAAAPKAPVAKGQPLSKGQPKAQPQTQTHSNINKRVAIQQDKILLSDVVPVSGVDNANVIRIVNKLVSIYAHSSSPAQEIFKNTLREIYAHLDEEAEWNEAKVKSLITAPSPKTLTDAHTVILNLKSRFQTDDDLEKAIKEVPFLMERQHIADQMEVTKEWQLDWNILGNFTEINNSSAQVILRMRGLTAAQQDEFIETLKAFGRVKDKLPRYDEKFKWMLAPYLRDDSEVEFKKAFEFFYHNSHA